MPQIKARARVHGQTHVSFLFQYFGSGYACEPVGLVVQGNLQAYSSKVAAIG